MRQLSRSREAGEVSGKESRRSRNGSLGRPFPKDGFSFYWDHTAGQPDTSFEAMEAIVQLSVFLTPEFS